MITNRMERRAVAALAVSAIGISAIAIGCANRDRDDDYYYYDTQTYPYDDPYDTYGNDRLHDDQLREDGMRPGGTGTSGREGIDSRQDELNPQTISPRGNTGGVGSDDSGASDPS